MFISKKIGKFTPLNCFHAYLNNRKMKINKKLSLDALKSLAFSAYRTLINAEFKKVEKATADKPELFYFHMEHNFPKGKDKEDDAAGAKGLIAVFGKPDKAWKTEIKTKTKGEKKLTLAGKCYIETTDKGKVLNAFVAAGDASADKLMRAGKKLFAALGIISINFLGTIAEDALDVAEDETDEQDGEEENEAPVSAEQRLMELVDQYKALVAPVKAAISALLTGKSIEKAFEAGINALKANINAYLQFLPTAEPAIQEKFKAATEQMRKILAIVSGAATKDDAKEMKGEMQLAEDLKKLLDQALKISGKVPMDTLLINA